MSSNSLVPGNASFTNPNITRKTRNLHILYRPMTDRAGMCSRLSQLTAQHIYGWIRTPFINPIPLWIPLDSHIPCTHSVARTILHSRRNTAEADLPHQPFSGPRQVGATCTIRFSHELQMSEQQVWAAESSKQNIRAGSSSLEILASDVVQRPL